MKTRMNADARPGGALVLAIITVLILMFIIPGCGGVTKVNTDLHIPDLDRTRYNDSYYAEGWKNLKEGKPDQAIRNFEQSSSLDEKLYVGFGYAFLAKNKFQLAAKNFEQALAVNPENLQAQFGMASMYELLNEKERAFRLYSRLLAKYPGHAWIKIRYDYLKSTETGNYLKQAERYKNDGNLEAYVGALETASRYSPGLVEIKVEIADFFKSRQQYDRAASYYEQALEKLPNDEGILMKMADLYQVMNKFDSAVIIYKKMLELKPGDLDISNKINDLKIKFYEVNLPTKFKNIFFKEDLNREELAALIGYYFDKYLEPRPPVIITDIGASFAREYIIKVCTLKIMNLRPDHSFERFSKINRAAFAVVVNGLVKYLEKSAAGTHTIQFTPLEEISEPADISPLHKDYETIKFLVNTRIMTLDAENKFNPTLDISPAEVLVSIKKILNSIRER